MPKPAIVLNFVSCFKAPVMNANDPAGKNPLKFVLFGPESTGKSTLARALAEKYQTSLAPEYAREYLQKKWDEQQKTCEPEDLKPIVEGQTAAEEKAVQQAGKVVFFDTNPLQTEVYSLAYYGYAEDWLKEINEKRQYDFYFLTDIDIPWEKDDLRDKPHERKEMFALFKQVLDKRNLPYAILSGSHEERLKAASRIIDFLLHHPGFKPSDIVTFNQRNISLEQAARQLEYLKKGNLWQPVDRPATPGDGIEILSETQKKHYLELFENIETNSGIVKFVPASGAATRMFKDCYAASGSLQKNPAKDWQTIIEENQLTKCRENQDRLSKLSFYPQWTEAARKQCPDFDQLSPGEQMKCLVITIIENENFGLAQYPKALIPFHAYPEGNRTAFEEHLVESMELNQNQNTRPHVHFTVNPEKEKLFEQKIHTSPLAQPVQISFSYQMPHTDTFMLDQNGQPVRDTEGQLIFRPGGHGALIENLQNTKAEIVLIKNIDNVQKDEYKHDTYEYWKIITGMLLETVKTVHAHLWELENLKPTGEKLKQIIDYARETLHLPFIEGFNELPASHKREYLIFKLNRPVRIAGMVLNTGAPGGGPFWSYDSEGNLSLQIVEKSQINLNDPYQREALEKSTHFNPVFMAVYLKDYKGKNFDLKEFIRPGTGFVSTKTHQGKPVLIYEHPGLWNGAMYHWISRFVEVPSTVFSPVKEFYDLTRPPHV